MFVSRWKQDKLQGTGAECCDGKGSPTPVYVSMLAGTRHAAYNRTRFYVCTKSCTPLLDYWLEGATGGA